MSTEPEKAIYQGLLELNITIKRCRILYGKQEVGGSIPPVSSSEKPSPARNCGAFLMP